MTNHEKRKIVFIQVIKWAGLALAVIFILFSTVPYLFPTEIQTIDRHQLVFPNSEFIEVSDLEIHYRKWKAINGKEINILLVHGLGASTFSWRYTAPVLQEEGFRVIAVDLPGFGLSERKAGLDHSPEGRGELLWAMLEELHSSKQWNLVGHSMGGATVTAMALQKPDQTKSVTLAAGALAGFEPSFFTSLLKYPPVSQWVRVLGSRFLLDEGRVEQLLASAYGRQPTEHEIKGYYLPLTIEKSDAVLADLLKTVPESLLDRLDKLDRPVLCIWGEDDAWVPVEHGKKLDRLLPISDLIIMPGEGHCPMETAPDKFDNKLIDFLAALN